MRGAGREGREGGVLGRRGSRGGIKGGKEGGREGGRAGGREGGTMGVREGREYEMNERGRVGGRRTDGPIGRRTSIMGA